MGQVRKLAKNEIEIPSFITRKDTFGAEKAINKAPEEGYNQFLKDMDRSAAYFTVYGDPLFEPQTTPEGEELSSVLVAREELKIGKDAGPSLKDEESLKKHKEYVYLQRPKRLMDDLFLYNEFENLFYRTFDQSTFGDIPVLLQPLMLYKDEKFYKSPFMANYTFDPKKGIMQVEITNSDILVLRELKGGEVDKVSFANSNNGVIRTVAEFKQNDDGSISGIRRYFTNSPNIANEFIGFHLASLYQLQETVPEKKLVVIDDDTFKENSRNKIYKRELKQFEDPENHQKFLSFYLKTQIQSLEEQITKLKEDKSKEAKPKSFGLFQPPSAIDVEIIDKTKLMTNYQKMMKNLPTVDATAVVHALSTAYGKAQAVIETINQLIQKCTKKNPEKAEEWLQYLNRTKTLISSSSTPDELIRNLSKGAGSYELKAFLKLTTEQFDKIELDLGKISRGLAAVQEVSPRPSPKPA